jgi:hypothetical protein
LSVNGSKEYSNRLSVTAELSEDFSKLSPKDKANAPIAQFDKKECNFGEIKQGEKTSCDFTLTNAGKSILFIRKTKASCGVLPLPWDKKKFSPANRQPSGPLSTLPANPDVSINRSQSSPTIPLNRKTP